MKKAFRFYLGVWFLAGLFGVSGLSAAEAVPSESEQAPTGPVVPPIRTSTQSDISMTGDIPDWQARLELARVLSYAKHYDESVAEYRLLIREKPDLIEARLELATVLYWQGKHDESLAVMQSVQADKLGEEARLVLADLYTVRKEYAKAEAIFMAYLKMHPADVAVRTKLADLFSWQKKYEASLALFAALVAERPDDTQLRRKYAFVLIWAGQHEKGAEELKRTLAPAPLKNTSTSGTSDKTDMKEDTTRKDASKGRTSSENDAKASTSP